VGDFVHLKRRGINHIGLCPFHHEKTPSFNVSAAKGIFKCFGCGEGGDAVQFVIKILEKSENCFSILDRTWDIFHAIYCENVDLLKKMSSSSRT